MLGVASILSSSTYDLPTRCVRFNLDHSHWQLVSVPALAHLIHDSASGAKQTDLYGIGVQVQNLGNFLNGKAFYFLQDQHHTVAFVQAFQQALDLLLGLELVQNILGATFNPFCDAELLGLLLAEIGFIQKRPNLLLSQQIPALVDGNFIEPSAKGGALVETLQREIGLHQDLLGDVLDVFAAAEDSAGNGKNAMLVAMDQLFVGLLVSTLGAPN